MEQSDEIYDSIALKLTKRDKMFQWTTYWLRTEMVSALMLKI
jgi:hypothetical protein